MDHEESQQRVREAIDEINNKIDSLGLDERNVEDQRLMLRSNYLIITDQLFASYTASLTKDELENINDYESLPPSQEDIDGILDDLMDVDLVEKVESGEEVYYSPTKQARDLRKDMGLYENLGLLHQVYRELEGFPGSEEPSEERYVPEWASEHY